MKAQILKHLQKTSGTFLGQTKLGFYCTEQTGILVCGRIKPHAITVQSVNYALMYAQSQLPFTILHSHVSAILLFGNKLIMHTTGIPEFSEKFSDCCIMRVVILGVLPGVHITVADN